MHIEFKMVKEGWNINYELLNINYELLLLLKPAQ